LSRKRREVLDAERIRGTNSVVDISSIAGLIVSSVAAVISILACKAAQRSADAERQTVEASRSVLISQVVALHEAQATAQDKAPRVSVHLEDTCENPSVFIPCGNIREGAASSPARETLDHGAMAWCISVEPVA
jgi:hypothetical protein